MRLNPPRKKRVNNKRVQGGEDSQDALSSQVISPKRAL